jgi:Uma2 family endonuclease
MPTGTLISVEQYLATSYRPDCDYVDGRIEERNFGEWDHSKLQAAITAYFYQRRKTWNISVAPEQRVQVSPTRFRIPDVCVVLGEPDSQIFRQPPFICIEILSKDDRMTEMQQRINDYLAMGVYVATPAAGFHEFKGNILRTENPVLELPLAEVFA